MLHFFIWWLKQQIGMHINSLFIKRSAGQDETVQIEIGLRVESDLLVHPTAAINIFSTHFLIFRAYVFGCTLPPTLGGLVTHLYCLEHEILPTNSLCVVYVKSPLPPQTGSSVGVPVTLSAVFGLPAWEVSVTHLKGSFLGVCLSHWCQSHWMCLKGISGS